MTQRSPFLEVLERTRAVPLREASGHASRASGNALPSGTLCFRIALSLFLALGLASCQPAPSPVTPTIEPLPITTSQPSPVAGSAKSLKSVTEIPRAQPGKEEIILATTTSTQDSGLLDIVIPIFQGQTGYRVKPIAVGTGQALAMGRRGEADVLLVHAPDSELELMKSGDAVNRQLVMHNDFVLLGPPNDPAKVRDVNSVLDALKKIADGQSLFISRGDDSGTDKLEKALWKELGINAKGQTWYQETGQGMGNTLNIAAEKSAYAISDRATFLARRKGLGLDILNSGDKKLLNIYHVMEVNNAKHTKVNSGGAKAFVDFFVARETQETIAQFGVDKYGEPLFFPDAGKKAEELGG